jgi:thymidylate kinase
MLIIVEGVDGVGKTTLVNALRERCRGLTRKTRSVGVLHAGPPTKQDMLEEYELPLQWYRSGEHSDVICDRWHLGELIYGPLLRGESRLDPVRLLHVEKFLDARGAVVVHLTAPPAFVRERRAKKEGIEEDLLDDKHLEHVINRYFDVAWNSHLMTFEFVANCDEDRYHEAVDQIIAQAWRHEMLADDLNNWPTYVGDPDPHVLLLGDRRNQNFDTRWTAAFVPVNGSSGRYLLESLPEQYQMTAGIANACEEEHLGDLVETLGNPPVVALGSEAHHRLLRDAIPHGAVPHPQWVRRFHHNSREAYGNIIRQAALYQEDYRTWTP